MSGPIIDLYKGIFDLFEVLPEHSRSYYMFLEGAVVAALTISKQDAGKYGRTMFSGETIVDHISVCGVAPYYRGMGLFRQLIDLLKKDPDTTDTITISINPTTWPAMYAWVQKKKNKLVAVEVDGGSRELIFMLWKKDL